MHSGDTVTKDTGKPLILCFNCYKVGKKKIKALLVISVIVLQGILGPVARSLVRAKSASPFKAGERPRVACHRS